MSYADAVRSYETEVDSEAERLVREGVAPYEAIGQAKTIVESRRRLTKTGPAKRKE